MMSRTAKRTMSRHHAWWLLAALWLCACKPATDQPVAAPDQVTVTYWRHYKDTEEAAMLALIKRFEAKNPGVRVRLRTFPYDVYRTKVVATLSAGEGAIAMYSVASGAMSMMASATAVPCTSPFSQSARLEEKTPMEV